MSTPDQANVGGLSAAQQRFQFLTQEAGLDFDEACHALGRREGCLPEYRRLSHQEQLLKVQEYVNAGLTAEEAERIVVGAPPAGAAGPRHAKPMPARKVPSLDWMPARRAFNEPSPGRSRRGLLK